ncbi:MAG: hypothetical protein BM563_09885 [Bacteroidetes bacterium MedPE-SWsnd-G1]|nr:MAG: hypothetical protein BM563_09885 [Bacteroidetes bacterium MedPE-SWsnd-G1]
MRTTIILLILILTAQVFSQKSTISIETNKNLEFLGYIIEQGDPMGNDKNHPISAIINTYPENKNNETLFKLFDLASDLDYSTLTHLMYFLPELPLDKNFRISNELASNLGFKSKSEQKKLNEIVIELNNFFDESNFEIIWKELSPYRKDITSFLQINRPESMVFEYMETFYQYKYKYYRILPIMTLWPAGFGIRDVELNSAIFVMGPLNINYDFNDEDSFNNLTIHEFGHSFVNHVVLKNKKQLQETKHLFVPIKESMIKQGYSNWNTCMIEHFVRAGEVIIRRLMGDNKQGEELLNEYAKNRNFVYLKNIVDHLSYYHLKKKYSYDVAVKLTLDNLSKVKN